MRVIDPALQAHLDSGATTLCRAWVLTRKDGLVLGFTDHDVALNLDGVTCEAVSGFEAGAIESSTGMSVDNALVRGALTSDRIAAEDVLRGKWDGAGVEAWWVNWKAPGQKLRIFAGSLGEIRQGPLAFEAELRGEAAKLNQPLGRAYLRHCDAVLGDGRCGVGLTALAVSATIAAVSEGALSLAAEGEEGRFTGGLVTWTDGRKAVIRDDSGSPGNRLLSLWQDRVMEPGEVVTLSPGCDKLAATCRDKFSNFLNFRGFPDIPGEDWLTAFPGQGTKLDGGSLRRGT